MNWGGGGIMAQQVKLLTMTLAFHVDAGSCPGCATSCASSCNALGKAVKEE